MATLTVEVPDSVVAELESVARLRECSVAEVILERVASVAPESPSDKRDGVLRKLREEGLIGQRKPDLSIQVRAQLDERRRKLAERAGKSGPLSELIIQERR